MPSLFSESHFHQHAQEIFDTFYLKPFSDSKNKLHQHGYIDRMTHGAMHAGRVAIYIELLHQQFKQLGQFNVEAKLKDLSKCLGYSPSELITLTKYLGLLHHAGRTYHTVELFERDIAHTVKSWLIAHHLKADTAELFTRLLSRKNEPLEKSKVLEDAAINIDARLLDGMNYLRVLLSIAENLDEMRKSYTFEYKSISSLLSQLPGYQPAAHDPVFDALTQNVYALLKEMKEIYFQTRIVDASDQIHHKEEPDATFSIHEKIKIEHANNVYLALLNRVKKQPAFNQLLSASTVFPIGLSKRPFLGGSQVSHIGSSMPLHFLKQTLDHQPFYPLIHGTNSKILPILSKSGFKIQGPLALIEGYGYAPLCGELVKGGLGIPGRDTMPCFSLVTNSNERDVYDLEKILKSYATVTTDESTDIAKAQDSFLETYNTVSKDMFSDVNVFIMKFARLKQMGCSYDEEGKKVLSQIKQTINVLYFYLLIAKYTVRHPELERKLWWDKLGYRVKARTMDDSYYTAPSNVTASLEAQFDYHQLLERFEREHVDLAHIYHNYDQKNYQSVLDKLGFSLEGKQIFQAKHEESLTPNREPFERLDYILKGIAEGRSDKFLSEWVIRDDSGLLRRAYEKTMVSCILSRIEGFNHAYAILNKLMEHQPEPINLSDSLITAPFPIVLIKTTFDSINSAPIGGEFRSNRALVIGEDINAIATDTPETLTRLNAFLSQHGLSGKVKTMLFDELKTLHSIQKAQTTIPLSLKCRFFPGEQSALSSKQPIAWAALS